MAQSSAPKTLKIVGGVFLFAAAAVLVVWFVSGAKMVTQYQVETTVVEIDEDFGDEVERTVMEDRFQFGLLPDKGYDAAAPLMAFFGVLGLLCLFLARRKDSGDAPADEQQPENDPDPTAGDTSASEPEEEDDEDDEDDEEEESTSGASV